MLISLHCSEKGQAVISSPDAADKAHKCFETILNYFKRHRRLSPAFMCFVKSNSIISPKSSKFDSFCFSSHIISASNWKLICLQSKCLKLLVWDVIYHNILKNEQGMPDWLKSVHLCKNVQQAEYYMGNASFLNFDVKLMSRDTLI